MNLIGEKVKHSKFGEGVITQHETSYVSVKFLSEAEIKKFVYPTCFGKFLQLLDTDADLQIKAIMNKYESQKNEEKQQDINTIKVHSVSENVKNSLSSRKIINFFQFNSVTDFCTEYKRAINSEISYLKNTGGKRQKIIDGIRIEYKNGIYAYTFESDDELTYPEGTQINIWQSDTSISGYIIGCEGFTVIIACSINLGKYVPVLVFSAEPWRLLSALNERLDSIADNSSNIVKYLICDGKDLIDYKNCEITTGQQAAVQMSKRQPITFVWGPPGTGKTQTLAKMVLDHIEQGNRVLMLSYSNVSVDGAIMRVHAMNPNAKPGTLVRYGYARNKELLKHHSLISYYLAIHKHPNLQKEYQKLVEELKNTSRASQKYIDIKRRLAQIKNILSYEEKNIVKNADFVATTVSKSIVDSTIYESEFDVVIFDEASMAYVPQIVFAAGIAKKHFVCMGDFRQLPPIVQSNGTSLLNTDIFQHCGITYAIDNKINHKWLCMLDVQYRMHPCIAEFVNINMYDGLLHSSKDMENKYREIIEQKPINGYAIAFADLSGMMSVCSKTKDNSRVNILSALISFSLALEAAKNYEVGIITPYRSQSRLFHSMARDVAESNPELKPIVCSTVHQFQGSEKDIIVYDCVDCYRMPYPGMLLTSAENNYANRLYNVALTRSKGKFIGVANIAYMDNKKISKNLMFKRMIEEQREKQSCIDGQNLSRRRAVINSKTMRFFDNEEGYLFFIKDIIAANLEIRIDIPDKPVEDKFFEKFATALQIALKNGVKVYLRAENKQAIPDILKPFAIENTFTVNPVVLIDKKIVWFGMPSSEANFKSEGHIIQTQYRPIIRFKGVHTVNSLYSLTEMDNIIDQSKRILKDNEGKVITNTFASYVLAYKKCPSCGKPMKLKKSRKGKFFLACTDYPTCCETAYVSKELVEEYFRCYGERGYRCKHCDCLLEAKLGQYGLYIQCCGIQRHKYKLDEI